uniref:hypothetical protein n=1 Tax=uncultured Caulobacter sp. TaxID=158749 RepID=UPI0025E4CBB7|nr:hypothetical protein [uncultured Caulobacter sp.]
MRISTSVLLAGSAIVAIAGATFVFQATAMGVDRAPPPKTFTQYGQTYQWGVAHGVTGGLIMSGPPRADGSNVGLVLSCSGLRSGGVVAHLYEPQVDAAQLRVRTQGAVFRVQRGIETFKGRSYVDGQGDMPDGYLRSLASTGTVSIEYGDRVTTFPGPGKALAEHFGRYCAQLAQRALHDE